MQSDERIEQSVARMTTIIDLARNIRERHNKPLKAPLRLVDNSAFLLDLVVKVFYFSFFKF